MTESLINPYPGLRPFERGERVLFFGRERELQILIDLVLAHRAVLVYGGSGTGKTSLIRAGLLPGLVSNRVETLPVARVGLSLDEATRRRVANPYIHSVLRSLDPAADPNGMCDVSLQQFYSGMAQDGKPRVLLFDQFEELFITYPDRWADREDFLDQVGQTLDANSELSVIFSMREDYVTQLDPYLYLIPDHLRPRLRLEPLRAEGARQAIVGPARASGVDFRNDAADRLVEDLLKIRITSPSGEIREAWGPFVDTVLLQIVCRSLWENLRRHGDVSEIELTHVEAFGDMHAILARYFDDGMSRTAHTSGIDEGVLRGAFTNHFITSLGTRGLVVRGREQTGGLPNETLDQLEAMRLVRSEFHAGARWYELADDRLLQSVEDSNRNWFLTHGAGQSRPSVAPGRETTLGSIALAAVDVTARLGALQRQVRRYRIAIVVLSALLAAALAVIARNFQH